MGKVKKNTRKPSVAARIKQAVEAWKQRPIAERIQLMVKAKLLTQEEADQAKRRIAESTQGP